MPVVCVCAAWRRPSPSASLDMKSGMGCYWQLFGAKMEHASLLLSWPLSFSASMAIWHFCTITQDLPSPNIPAAVVSMPTELEPSSPKGLNRSGRKQSIAKPEALETGWDLFYRSGSGSSPKAKPKPKVVVPKVGKAASDSRRNSAANTASASRRSSAASTNNKDGSGAT